LIVTFAARWPVGLKVFEEGIAPAEREMAAEIGNRWIEPLGMAPIIGGGSFNPPIIVD